MDQPVPQVDDTTTFAPPVAQTTTTTTTVTNPPPTGETTVVAPSGNGGAPKKRFPVAAIFGILLLILGVGAGLLLVSQSQVFREKASGTCTNHYVDATTIHLCPGIQYSVSTWTCPNALDPVSGQCFCSSGHGTATTTTITVDQNQFPDGEDFKAPTVQCGSSQWDVNTGGGQGIDGGGVCYSSGTDCGGGGGGPTATPVPTATPKPICGGTCSVDADCAPSSGGNVHPVCDPTTHTCQNPNCIGYTTPGTICTCGPAPSALECGALCGGQNDGQVFPTNCLNGVCGNNANGGTTGNRCLPNSPSAGYVTKGGSCKQDPNPAVYCINHADGTPVLTVSDLLAACAPAPTTPPNITAACSAVRIYDANWNLLTTSQLSALKAGSIIHIAVTGTTSSGTFDQARFTVNGALQTAVTTVKPGTTQEFYQDYTIPTGITSFIFKGEIHHKDLNQWF